MKIGSPVKSLYKKHWKGVVVRITKRKGQSDLAVVAVTHDKNGNEINKPYCNEIDVAWLKVL